MTDAQIEEWALRAWSALVDPRDPEDRPNIHPAEAVHPVLKENDDE
jgi:hypothetical protein